MKLETFRKEICRLTDGLDVEEEEKIRITSKFPVGCGSKS